MQIIIERWPLLLKHWGAYHVREMADGEYLAVFTSHRDLLDCRRNVRTLGVETEIVPRTILPGLIVRTEETP